jgi:hypothetical protein
LWPCHSIWKESFWRSEFSPQISSNPQVLRRRSIKKEERKNYWKKKEKRGRKRKAPRVSLNKGEVNILRGENTSTSKISFLIWFHFLHLHDTILKTLSKIIEKVFLAIFGPSFNLAIYITWVVPFLFTHELHIFSL